MRIEQLESTPWYLDEYSMGIKHQTESAGEKCFAVLIAGIEYTWKASTLERSRVVMGSYN